MTPLTRQRLKQLAEEATALNDWTTVRDYALQMYGEKAARVVIDTYGEYNDEGGTNYSIESVAVYDKDGKELHFDHSLPFFASSTWGKDGNEDEDKDEREDSEDEEDEEDEGNEEEFREFEEIYRLADEDKERGWVLIEDLPFDVHEGGSVTYDLTRQPSILLPIA